MSHIYIYSKAWARCTGCTLCGFYLPSASGNANSCCRGLRSVGILYIRLCVCMCVCACVCDVSLMLRIPTVVVAETIPSVCGALHSSGPLHVHIPIYTV